MSLYTNIGELVTSVYECDGDMLSYGYDKDGTYFELTEPDVLTVMSYNIQHGSGINGDQTIRDTIFKKYNPHVIGFQEAFSAGTLTGGTWVSHNYFAVNGVLGNIKAVASLFELTDFQEVSYSAQGAEDRGYLKMYINHNGKSICIVCTHLEMTTNTYDEVRYAQIAELIEVVRNEPYFIILADLNVGRCFDTENKYYINMIKPLLDAGFHCANCSEFGFIPTAWGDTTGLPENGYMCDNIVTSSNIIIESVIADTTKIDANTGLTIDHIPLVAKVRIL